MQNFFFNFESITYSVKQRENVFAGPSVILRSSFQYFATRLMIIDFKNP